MSATNRGALRATNDFYATPTWLTEAIIPELKQRLPAKPNILEPAVGQGAMIDVLDAAFPDATLLGLDIADVPVKHTERFSIFDNTDFLASEPSPEFDLIATNPPFTLAQEFIEKALAFRRPRTDLNNREGLVVMLLRLNFLEGQRRAAWLRDLRPSVYISPRRPSFTSDGQTDATGYGFFFFDGRGELHWLPTER